MAEEKRHDEGCFRHPSPVATSLLKGGYGDDFRSNGMPLGCHSSVFGSLFRCSWISSGASGRASGDFGMECQSRSNGGRLLFLLRDRQRRLQQQNWWWY